jgi:hypothetical protein
VLEKVHIEGLGRNEEVLVQAEPLGTLTEERAKWSTLPIGILDVATKDGFQNTEERVHLTLISGSSATCLGAYAFLLHVQNQSPSGQLPDREENDVLPRTEPLWRGTNLR